MPLKKIFIYVAAFMAVGLILFLAFLAGLPSIVEPRLKNRLPKIAEKYPIEFNIEKLGFSSTFISDIRIAEGISVDAMEIEYAVGFSDMPEVKKITASGLTIHARLDKDNQIHIGGLNLNRLSKQNTASNQTSDRGISPFLSYLPEKFVLKNAKLVLNIKGHELLIPLEALSRIQRDKGKITVKASVYPFGEKVNALVDYDLKKGIERIKIEGRAFDLGHLDQFAAEISDKMHISGPVDFSLSSSSPQKKWDLDISKISFIAPLNIRIDEIKTIVLINKQKVSVQGNLKFQYPQMASVPVAYTGEFDLQNPSVFTADIRTNEIKTLNIPQASGSLAFVSPGAVLKISGTEETVSSKIDINCKNGSFISEEKKFSFKNALMRLNISAALADREKNIHMTGDFTVPYISYNGEHTFSCRGKIAQSDGEKIIVDGSVDIDTLKQAETGFKILVGLKDKLKINAGFDVAPFELTHNDIQKWLPSKMESAEFDVTAQVSGSADWVDNKLKTAMQVSLKSGNVRLPDAKLTAAGINSSISFNDLLVPETVPGQILTIDSVEVDKVKISDVKLRFSIEDASSVLAENIRFKWCNGTVTTEAIRLPQEDDYYALSLYCDRLEMTQLLEQIGAFSAEGSGTLNGKIPVRYKDGDIFFDNGFLFSTPGSGGKIKVSNTDVLTAGIPLDSPQFSELDLAREALKNFDYKWAKLSFNTAKDILTVNMELDGKPTGVMPFEYKKEIGRFIRVDTKSPGSNFQGIKLDVNLNLPFNEVLKFGNKLKSFL